MKRDKENIYKVLDLLFDESDDLIDFENKPMSVIIKDITKMSFKVRKYKALVERDINMLFANIENMYGKKYVNTLESSKRALTSKDLIYYVNGDDTVFELRKSYDHLIYYKNRLDGIITSIDQFSYQLNNLTRLVIDKLDDYTLE